jgi:hypothetical protein
MRLIKKYNEEQLREILVQVIARGKRHSDYKHVVALRRRYFQYLTGKYQDDLIVSYKDRESDTQKEQRIKITQPRTPYYGSIAMQPFEEIARAEDFKPNLASAKENAENIIAEIQSRLDNFCEGMSLRSYMDMACRHYNFYDPNAWFITEFANHKPLEQKPFTFPLVVNSSNALDYEYYLGELQYLVYREPIFIKSDDNTDANMPAMIKSINSILGIKDEVEKGDVNNEAEPPEGYNKGYRYLLYAPDIAIEYVETNAKDGIELADKKRYYYQRYDTKSMIVPAARFGYLKDPETDLRTYVSPLHPANSLFEEAIQRKSEIDLHLALHGFLQKYTYGRDCNHKSAEDGYCDAGKMNKSKTTCSVCKGVGKLLHTTVQDVVIVNLPNETVENGNLPKIQDLVYYVQVPTELINLQREVLKDLEADILRAVFNTRMFESKVVQTTATEVIIDKIPINNVLKKAADHQAELMKLATIVTAIHTSNYDGFSCSYSYGGDFRLESIAQLLEQRQAAVNAGAPAAIIEAIDNKILHKQFPGDTAAIMRAKCRANHRPFRERAAMDKQFLLATIEPTNPLYVLEVFFEAIMDEIENANRDPEFYKLEFTLQKELISKKVAEYVDQIKPAQVALPANV